MSGRGWRRWSLWLGLAWAFLALGGAAWGGPLSLTILHVNDTHAHLEASQAKLALGQAGQIRAAVGGVARLAHRLQELRAQVSPSLFLHAGDMAQGTLYFTLFDGRADVDFYNELGLEAMCLGNHEFDRGSEALAKRLAPARFPVLAANLDASAEPGLKDLIKPYVVKEFGAEKVGIVGLVTPDTPNISNPGEKLRFLDPAQSTRQALAELKAQGVDKVILLTHLGYEADVRLAAEVPEVQVIVGGHSHTLLGPFKPWGLDPEGEYPTLVERPGGGRAVVVQAWMWGNVLGRLRLDFDATGKVVGFAGQPNLLWGEPLADAQGQPLSPEKMSQVKALNPVAEDRAALAKLAGYSRDLAVYRTKVVGRVTADLKADRLPSPTNPEGSPAAALVARSMLAKVRDSGSKTDFAVINAGGVRTEIKAGPLTVADVYGLLPFGNTLVTVRLTGAEIKEVLEDGLEAAVKGLTGAVAYPAGLGYRVELKAAKGGRVVDLVTDQGQPLDPGRRYLLVVNSFLANGRDGHATLGRLQAEHKTYDTGFIDAEALMEFVQARGVVEPGPSGVSLRP